MTIQATPTSPLLRRLNATAVLAVMRERGPMTGSDLMSATGLSRPTVHAVCDDLISLGWVTELDSRRASGAGRIGRRARCYEFNARAGFVFGIDMGAHTVRVVLADLRGELVGERCHAFADEFVPAAARLHDVRDTVDAVLGETGIGAGAVLAAGLGVPAPVDRHGHVVAFDSYLPGLAPLDLRTELLGPLGWPVFVENDANLAVLAERWRGVARGVEDVVELLAGERLGAGLYLGGQLLRGSDGGAGELGFLTMVSDVGNTDAIAGLVRELGSRAVADAVRRRPATGPPAPGSLVARVNGEPDQVRAEAVFAAVRDGDPVAIAVLDRVLDRMARVIAVLATLLNPELVVIAGAVADGGTILVTGLNDRLPTLTKTPPRVAVSGLGDHAVVSGAIRLALDHVESNLSADTAGVEPLGA